MTLRSVRHVISTTIIMSVYTLHGQTNLYSLIPNTPPRPDTNTKQTPTQTHTPKHRPTHLQPFCFPLFHKYRRRCWDAAYNDLQSIVLYYCRVIKWISSLNGIHFLSQYFSVLLLYFMEYYKNYFQ